MSELDERGFRILLVDLVAKFIAPAVATEVVAIRRAGHDWHQRIERDGRVLFTAQIRAAITDRAGRPVRVPDFVRLVLSR